jgi:hypothetical protein
MALRLIEMVLQEKDGGEVRELLKEHKVLEHRQVRLQDGEVLRNKARRYLICWGNGTPARMATAW